MKIIFFILVGLLSSLVFAQQDRGGGAGGSGGKGGNGTFHIEMVLREDYEFDRDHCPNVYIGLNEDVCQLLRSNRFISFQQNLFLVNCCRANY